MWKWTRRYGHPDERALMLAAVEPLEGGDPAVVAHLAGCERCRAAVAQASDLWDEVRAGVQAEADAVFSDAVLERQRAHVLRRLEQQGHPARVLRFPASPSGRFGPRSTTHRWVAAAAAAGLVVGVLTGRFLPGQSSVSSSRPTSAAMQPASARPATPGHVTDRRTEADEAFLVDLEMAAASPRIEPLQALDAMTPRMSDGRR